MSFCGCHSGCGGRGVWGSDALVSTLSWRAKCSHLSSVEICTFLADRGTLFVWSSADECTATSQPAGACTAWRSCPLQAAEGSLGRSRSLHGAAIWIWLLQARVAVFSYMYDDGCPTADCLTELHLLPVQCRITKRLACLTYKVLVLLRPRNFHCHHVGWLLPNQHRHCYILQCSRRSFWALVPENCPSFMQAVWGRTGIVI